MIIPKGKKFQFRINDLDKKGGNKMIQGVNYDTIVPAIGYKGNAYIGQDVNISLNSNFSKPLEGILGGIPHTMDLLYQAKTGTSLNNSRFTHIKYWTGTEAPEVSLQLLFETQVDSFYDVYLPVRDLMRLALPEETDVGFYRPPVPTVRLVAGEFSKFVTAFSSELTKLIASGLSAKQQQVQKDAEQAQQSASGSIESSLSTIEKTGFQTDLYVGNNFKFKNIMIKNVSPTFSSELAYAPLHFLNKLWSKEDNKKPFFNLYTMMEGSVKGLSQSVGAVLATGANLAHLGSTVANSIPKILRNYVDANIKDMPSFPISAEVNITFELQFPLTRNIGGKDTIRANSIDMLFSKEGFEELS